MLDLKPDSEETSRLLERIEKGQLDAFDSLLARHRDWLRRLVEMRRDGRLQARVDASDVVQETQMETYRRLDDFLVRRPMPFRLWLRKTLQERLKMMQRRHIEASRRAVGREVGQPDNSTSPMWQQLAGIDPSPSQNFARDELARRVRDSVAKLEETDREILLMRTFEGLSYAEIAFVLEVEPAAARKRHGRALLRLHNLLTESGLTESQL
ncbi:MAG: sigma-70 family RNA polymerase sigma factor [Planctomycetia bacterium]|nr:sigma-70 family RNA polymerase sigma factor [Planctomycetia bacterium]